MEIVSRLLLVLVLNILWIMTGYAASLLNKKNTFSQNVFRRVNTECSSDEQCREWLPISETYDDTIIIPEEDSDISRSQSRRQMANPMPEIVLKSLKDSISEKTRQEIRPPLLTNKQIPTRFTKKDVFPSRSWSAGGMPFSVLYMKTHGPRSNHAITATSTSQRQESGTTKSSTSSTEHSNSRITPRNGQPTGQPRRQYWTIPQLFISYGWGSFGK